MSAISGPTSPQTKIDHSDPTHEPIETTEKKEKEKSSDDCEKALDCTKKTVEVISTAYEVYQAYNSWKKA